MLLCISPEVVGEGEGGGGGGEGEGLALLAMVLSCATVARMPSGESYYHRHNLICLI